MDTKEAEEVQANSIGIMFNKIIAENGPNHGKEMAI
jgi:hypothetical protein